MTGKFLWFETTNNVKPWSMNGWLTMGMTAQGLRSLALQWYAMLEYSHNVKTMYDLASMIVRKSQQWMVKHSSLLFVNQSINTINNQMAAVSSMYMYIRALKWSRKVQQAIYTAIHGEAQLQEGKAICTIRCMAKTVENTEHCWLCDAGFIVRSRQQRQRRDVTTISWHWASVTEAKCSLRSSALNERTNERTNMQVY